ncbi:MAG: archaeal heat shock protein Hsp20 [Candidatus Bathyarchaeota archaeon]
MSWDEWFGKRKRFPFDFGPGSPYQFRDMDDVMKELEKTMEEMFRDFTGKMPQRYVRERKHPDGSVIREFGPFVYGYSMTIGPDGKPQIREFGNIKHGTKPSGFGTAKPEIDIKDVREPLVDVMSTNGEVKVTVELPGVNKKDIKLHATENTLTISVEIPARKYYKDLELPSEVDPKSAKSTYLNGVLEVTLSKVKGKKPKGIPINVE